MKKLDINRIKTERQFLRNYSLHDIAENEGIRILNKYNIKFKEFGEDRRYEDVWEAGDDKPDIKIFDKNNKLLYLLDWKGKKSSKHMINKRAFESYTSIAIKLNVPVIIAIAKMDRNKKIFSFIYYLFPNKDHHVKEETAWDGNKVSVFNTAFCKDFYKINEIFK